MFRSNRDLPATLIWFQPMCGSLTFFGSDITEPCTIPSPAIPGASSLAWHSACKPRQIPRNGIPRPKAASRGPRIFLWSSARINAEKCPTPGSAMPSALAKASAVVARTHSAPSREKARSTEADVVGPVIDQGNLHKSPLCSAALCAAACHG